MGARQVSERDLRVPTCLIQGQNTQLSCRHTSADEFDILPVYLWAAANVSSKNLGNSYCREERWQRSKNKLKSMLVLGFWVTERYKMVRVKQLLNHLFTVAVDGWDLLLQQGLCLPKTDRTGRLAQGGGRFGFLKLLLLQIPNASECHQPHITK